MKGSRPSSSLRKKLPVFVFPEALQFVAEDESSHKQVLTVYNPYEFNIKFQVLSNAPHKYAVVETQGTIRAHCCVDIVVRHKLASDGPFDMSDKFRIDIYIDKKFAGRKLVLSTLVKKKPMAEGSDDSEKLPERSIPASLPYVQLPAPERHAPTSGPSILMIMVALVCLFVLLLPLEGESPGMPSYAHVTVNQKLIAAFALGLVTMAILKS